MDLIRAARRELIAHTSVTSLVGTDSTYSDGWIFQWERRREVEGTGAALIVLSARRGWAAPNKHNTASFPRLQVEIFQDHTRDSGRNPNAGNPPTTEEKASILYAAVDKIFHLPAHTSPSIRWGDPGGIRIVSSLRNAEPEYMDVPDGDGVVRCLVAYEVTLG